jgi:hypothetical protein
MIYLYSMGNKQEQEAGFIFKEKRKWQIALRRYVLNGNKSSDYAPYFGIDSKNFRNWIELQFAQGQNWDNFSKAWQFDHVVPVAFFDLANEDDLRLCWNFINIRIEGLDESRASGKVSPGIFSAIHYYQSLYAATGWAFCQQMLTKIEQIREASAIDTTAQANFITQNGPYLTKLAGFTPYDYDKLNSGTTADRIIAENELLSRFG